MRGPQVLPFGATGPAPKGQEERERVQTKLLMDVFLGEMTSKLPEMTSKIPPKMQFWIQLLYRYSIATKKPKSS